MATHSCSLAWRIPWKRSLAGYNPWDGKELDTTERLTLSLFLYIRTRLDTIVLQILMVFVILAQHLEVTLIFRPSGPAFFEMILKDKAVKFPNFLNYALKYMSFIWQHKHSQNLSLCLYKKNYLYIFNFGKITV